MHIIGQTITLNAFALGYSLHNRGSGHFHAKPKANISPPVK